MHPMHGVRKELSQRRIMTTSNLRRKNVKQKCAYVSKIKSGTFCGCHNLTSLYAKYCKDFLDTESMFSCQKLRNLHLHIFAACGLLDVLINDQIAFSHSEIEVYFYYNNKTSLPSIMQPEALLEYSLAHLTLESVNRIKYIDEDSEVSVS